MADPVRTNPVLPTPALARAFRSWLLAAVVAMAAPASAQLLMDEPPEDVQGVEVVEHLGKQLPTRLSFTDASGETVSLSSVFDGDKPVVVIPVYFGCPIICPLILQRLTDSFSKLDYTIGDGFEVLVFSIDPGEGPTESWAAKARYTEAYRAVGDRDASDVESGWHFVTGDETSIAELANACGWHFNALSNGEFSHPSAIMIASPDGTLTRYIYGLDFPAKQMKLSLLDASEGRIAASLGDRLLHYCYRFDPSVGVYTMEAMAVMRVAGVLTVIGLVALVGGLFAWERANRTPAGDAGTITDADGGIEHTRSAQPA